MNDLHKILTNQAEQWAMLGAPALCERFIARNGQCFEGRKLPKGFRRGTPKACFQNATLLADRQRACDVEGYAMNPDLPFPFLHAWCINVAGQVVDVTLKEPEKYQYVGIVLTRKELWDALKAKRNLRRARYRPWPQPRMDVRPRPRTGAHRQGDPRQLECDAREGNAMTWRQALALAAALGVTVFRPLPT